MMGTARIYAKVAAEMRRHSWRLALAVGEVLITSALEVLKPWPLKIVIDNVLGGARPQLSWMQNLSPAALLSLACLGLILLYLALSAFQVSNNYLTISIGQRMVNDLRARLFEHLQRLSLAFHRRREVGDLMMRINYDTFSIQTIAMNGMFPILSSLILLAAMFMMMLRIDPTLTLVALGVVPLLLILIGSISSRIDRLATGARARESELYNVAHRALSAIHVVQAFTREAEVQREFVEKSSASLSENLRLYMFQTLYSGAVSVLVAGGTALVIYIGARHVMEHRLTIGDLVVFVTYLASLYAPINQLFQTYGQVHSAVAGMRRCLELLELEPEIKDRPGARAAGRMRGAVEFRGVTFAYGPGEPVLKDISFKANPGETIAIVGPTGAGKTTLTSLLARFYEPQSGTVEIDGRAIEQVTLRSLRENIAIVLQPPMVLSDTIRANIALGKPMASHDEIARAAQMARLDPLLEKLPVGLDQIVGPGGHQLSQGEAQRVTIARALIKNAPILIMDEPTSALDAETESLVMAAVQEVMRGRTTLVIAHRLATIQNATRILVLRDGRIEEQGAFKELINAGGFFSYLYSLQSQQAGGAAEKLKAS
jgi:ATP-binding cassette subfamily B protein/subfamily B ATP-binding cassette protein MsbA